MYNRREDFEHWPLNIQIDPMLPIDNYVDSFQQSNKHLLGYQIDKCCEYIESFTNKGNPIIFNVKHFVYLLNNFSKKKIFFKASDEQKQINEIYWMSNDSFNKSGTSKIWRTFCLPKKSGDLREINAPKEPLMSIQKWIYENLLLPAYFKKENRWGIGFFEGEGVFQKPSNISKIVVHGFIPGKSIVTNARPHINRSTVLKLDLKDFFPSITADSIYFLFHKKFGYTIELSNIFSGLCTFKEKVLQGAPTSPMLANFICQNLDLRLYHLCKKYDFRYTRYADDITISGKGDLIKFEGTIKKIIEDEGFQLAENKIRFYKKGTRHLITGIVSNTKVNINKNLKKKIRAILYKCEKNGIMNDPRNHDIIFKNRLYGTISFINMVRPDLAEIFRKRANSLDWTEYDAWCSTEISEDLIKENEPFSNRRKISKIIQNFNDSIYWIDKYFSVKGLELLKDNINTTRIKNIKILMAVQKTNKKLREHFIEFKDELLHKGVETELRVIVDKKIERSFHDRWIFSQEIGYIVPSIDVIYRGQYSELKLTNSRPPYLDWFKNSKDIIKDWGEIERIREEIKDKSNF